MEDKKMYPEENGVNFASDENEQRTPDLDAVKPKIMTRLKAYIEKELPSKSKKKHAKILNKILEASADQLSFGTSPSYEMGYVYGNVSAKGKDYVGDTTYYSTIAVDLQTPEKPFFGNGDRDTCWAACSNIPRLRKAAYTLVRGKYTWAIYRCNEEKEALNDYAVEVCGEEFRSVDYELTDTRVNDYTYVQTEPHRDSHFYPVYLTTTNEKGKKSTICVGYYDADRDTVDCDIKFNEMSVAEKAAFIIVASCIAITVIAGIVAISMLM